MIATLMQPSGWYKIQPTGSGPSGESMTSPLGCSIFHDTSFQVPQNCSLMEGEVDRPGARRTCAASSCKTVVVAGDMAYLKAANVVVRIWFSPSTSVNVRQDHTAHD